MMKQLVLKSKILVLTQLERNEGNKDKLHIVWNVALRDTGSVIGKITTKASENEHCIEIIHDIEAKYDGNGYATEAVRLVTEWGFSNGEIYFVEAVADKDNAALKIALEKNDFVPEREEANGIRYVKEAADTYNMLTYMCLGMSLGMCFGTAQGNLGTGMSLGMCFGMAIGAMMDLSIKKKREKIRGARMER